MKLKRLIKDHLLAQKKRKFLRNYPKSSPGTVEWLVGAEIKYGGMVTGVSRNKVSPKDPRTREQLSSGGMQGGDRMLHHGYAGKYSEYMLPFVNRKEPLVLAEFGILKGSGLAIWCDLFPSAKVMGFDIDLGHTKGNMDHLKRLGAFQQNQPELHEFDQLIDNSELLGGILNENKIDICIDDGLHSFDSILTTMKSVLPYLADNFVYFVEDNAEVHKEIRSLYPDFAVDNDGEFTVVTNRGK